MPNQHTKPNSPSPAQIRRACQEIQSGWSESERRRRSGGREQAYEIPQVASPSRSVEMEPE